MSNVKLFFIFLPNIISIRKNNLCLIDFLSHYHRFEYWIKMWSSFKEYIFFLFFYVFLKVEISKIKATAINVYFYFFFNIRNTKDSINKRIIIFQLVLKIFFMLVISLLNGWMVRKGTEIIHFFLDNISFEYI